ncbi:uncharacterized protein ARMOST_09787 [Armillaria ostoyae]|uniref:Uncharacterized protein n=1 Tax=Armillaria ostoyae TaxID=47428 RepID=A0A284RCG0_ARMOS|nr:uncharacterized protein ARMOST_09787 [Armillaria ostoyae]
MGRNRTSQTKKDPKVKAPKIKGTQLIQVNQKERKDPKWNVHANAHLPNDAFFAGGNDFSYKSPVWEGDVGHGRWDDDAAKLEGSIGNRWTMATQFCFLARRQDAHKASTDEGTVHAFLGAVSNLFMHRWPPVYNGMIIDNMGRARTVDPKLLEVISSPEDAPFPHMDRGFLDLGLDLCLDGCELVEITDERRLELGFVLEAQRIQVKQWFPNNLKNKRGRAILGMKLKADLRHPPSLQHVYSHLLYDEHQIGTKVATEAEKLGVSHNNINIINRVTGEEWEKESEDVKQTVIKLHEEQKALSMAIKERRIDDIKLTAEQKSAVIESLGIEFNHVFNLIHGTTGWGFLIIGAGIDPETGKLRSSSWEYGTKLKSGENFFNRFDKDAVVGLVPGGLPGDKRKATRYFIGPLLAHMRNVERVQVELMHEPTSYLEAMEVDPLPRDVPEANNDVAMPSNDADSASKAILHPSPTPDDDPFPDFASKVILHPSPTPDNDPLPDFISPLPTPNFGPISSSATEAFPDQPAPKIAPDWDTFSMMFMPSQNTPVYNNDDVFLPSPPEGSFSSLEPEGSSSSFSSLDPDDLSFSLDAQAQPSGDGLDNATVWSESLMWQCYQDLLASFSTPNPSYPGGPSFDSNMPPMEPAPPLASPAAPTLLPSSGPTVPVSNELMLANTIMTVVHQKPTSDELRVKAPRRTPSNKPVQQIPTPDIPRQARNRKAPSSREITTLVSIEPSLPPWQTQTLASMRESTFGTDWDAVLEKWDALEAILIRENCLGKLLKKQPSVLKKWLDGPRSFTDPLVISDIDQFGVTMVQWWNSLQPNWRQTTEGMPLPNCAGPLTCLCKGGQNGIVSVLFGVFWWRRNCDGPSEWSLLVSDISNTFDALLNTTAPPKRRR